MRSLNIPQVIIRWEKRCSSVAIHRRGVLGTRRKEIAGNTQKSRPVGSDTNAVVVDVARLDQVLRTRPSDLKSQNDCFTSGFQEFLREYGGGDDGNEQSPVVASREVN